MRINKSESIQTMQRGFWTFICISAIVLIIKCCSVTTRTTITKTIKTVITEMISDCGLHMFEKQSNYLSYYIKFMFIKE